MSLKLVLDTNVVVSGNISTKSPFTVLDACVSEGGPVPVTSPDILDEYSRKLKEVEPVTVRDRVKTLSLIEARAEHVTPSTSLTVVEDDPDDDKFFEAAVEADADFIVSGDDHVLDIGLYEGIETISPRDMAERLG